MTDSRPDSRPARRVLIVADGDVPTAGELHQRVDWPAAETIVIAADGGLHKADLLGLEPALVVGDADSLAPATLETLEGRGIELQLHPAAKDASDTELAVREAVRQGATEIIVLGALGGVRFEHSISNVLLLALPELAQASVSLVDGRTVVRLASAGRGVAINGQPGDLVSLLPLSERVAGVRTRGLRYPLADDALVQGPSLGLSNELVGADATVEVASGRLAVIHTARTGEVMA